ncbi:RcpC/CpaB family pilus assembly protein [Streptomyces olivaceus]|uniref:RcpC/CpaB family pilus assembly protein n=1 Tax=Streptomyces olivaceus TaxID=47716 RepID=UPI00382B850D
MPHFAPVRVRGARGRLHRLVRHRRRLLAAGLVVTAAALVAAGPHSEAGEPDTRRARGHPVAEPVPERQSTRFVAAPVRIADAATVRLLRPGDRIDVVSTGDGGTGGTSVLARGVRVTEVPEPVAGAGAGAAADGALVVVSVPRETAHRLVGAGTTARLAVALC